MTGNVAAVAIDAGVLMLAADNPVDAKEGKNCSLDALLKLGRREILRPYPWVTGTSSYVVDSDRVMDEGLTNLLKKQGYEVGPQTTTQGGLSCVARRWRADRGPGCIEPDFRLCRVKGDHGAQLHSMVEASIRESSITSRAPEPP